MRLQVPSWLIPGGWLDNLRVAASLGWASGMELLVFSFEGADRALFLEESPRIEKEGRGLELGVHLPDPFLDVHRELVEATADYAAYYVVHPPRLDRGPGALEAFCGLLAGLRAVFGERFLLEYTRAPDFAAADRALDPIGLCADTAHLLAEGTDPAAWIGSRLDRVEEIHLNAYEDGRFHLVPRGDEAWLKDLLPLLSGKDARVELEVFSLAAVEEAYGILKESP
jgi:sugar phosphate isomerase/epimerase